jgi:hypothetical protein
LLVIPAKAGIQLVIFPLSRWRERVGVRVALDAASTCLKSKSFRYPAASG